MSTDLEPASVISVFFYLSMERLPEMNLQCFLYTLSELCIKGCFLLNYWPSGQKSRSLFNFELAALETDLNIPKELKIY